MLEMHTALYFPYLASKTRLLPGTQPWLKKVDLSRLVISCLQICRARVEGLGSKFYTLHVPSANTQQTFTETLLYSLTSPSMRPRGFR